MLSIYIYKEKKEKKNYCLFEYNIKSRYCVVSSIIFALDNKLYHFECVTAMTAMSLLQFMHWMRMNHRFIISSIEIPRFCYHHLLSIAANCRMCLIEEVGAPKLIVACANTIKINATYFSMNQLIRNVREHILEYLLLNHPLDCPICDQGGECDLQDITKVYGLDNSRYFNKIKKAVIFKDFINFIIKFKMTRCIHCTRCIRFFNEILDINLLGLINRGFAMKVSYFTENLYQYKASAFGNVVDICPVGALTLSNTEDKIRAWELIQKYSIDVFDSFASDIRLDWSGSDLFRVLPCLNQEVNDIWISDLTRFSYGGLKIQRLTIPFFCIKSNKSSILEIKQTDWAAIFNLVGNHYFINKYILKKTINFTGLTGIFSDAKSILSLKYCLNYLGSSDVESTYSTFNNVSSDFRKNFLLNLARFDWDTMRVLVLVGLDLRIESPLLFIKVNKYKEQMKIFYFGFSLKVDKFVQHLGLGLSGLIDFFEGKHYLSNFAVNTLLDRTALYSLHFFLGYSLVKRKDFNALVTSFDFFISIMDSMKLNRQVDYGVILPFIGRITGSELGVSPFNTNASSLFKNQQKFSNISSNLISPLSYNIFLNSFDDYEKKINKSNYNMFSIFIGSHLNDSFLSFFNVVLPSLSFLEKSTVYVNIRGSARFSKIVSSNIYGLADWIIISLLFKKFGNVVDFYNLCDFSFNNLIYFKSNLLYYLCYNLNLIGFTKSFFYIDLQYERIFNNIFNNFIYKFSFFYLGLDNYIKFGFIYFKKKIKLLVSNFLNILFYIYIYIVIKNFIYYSNLRFFFNKDFKTNKFYISTINYFNNDNIYVFFFNYFNNIIFLCNKLFFFKNKKNKKLFFFKEYFFKFNFSSNINGKSTDNYIQNRDYLNVFQSSNIETMLEIKLKLHANLFRVEHKYFMNIYRTMPYVAKRKKYYFWKSLFKYDIIAPEHKNFFEANHISRNSLELQGLILSYNKFFSYYK